MRNRYIINLAMLVLFSISSSVNYADEEEQKYVAPEPLQSMELVDTPDKDEAVIEKNAKELAVTIDRTWGLLLGDELNIVVDISGLENGLNETSLPEMDTRYGTWLYLKNIVVVERQLIFNYQVVNVPKKNTEVESPNFDIKDNNDHWFAIPSLPISIGPSLATSGGIGNLKLKGDIEPTAISTTKIKNKLKLYSIIAIVSSLLLALWHFGWKTKNRQPFSQATHDLGRLRWKRAVSPDEASRILHTAFNHTSNTTVVYGEIDNLIASYPWLKPLQEDIRVFYQQSEQHFFAREAGQEPDIDMIKKLAKACRSKEMTA
jgi:mxaA protein